MNDIRVEENIVLIVGFARETIINGGDRHVDLVLFIFLNGKTLLRYSVMCRVLLYSYLFI
jgi:hypothetical protein